MIKLSAWYIVYNAVGAELSFRFISTIFASMYEFNVINTRTNNININVVIVGEDIPFFVSLGRPSSCKGILDFACNSSVTLEALAIG